MMTARGETDSRQRAERRGRRAETIAAWYLRLKGFRILARRYRTPVGEIDLIARRGRLVAFVEVKQRPTPGEAAEAVGPAGRRRIARAAAAWLATHPAAAGLDFRFDVVITSPARLPSHICGAFDADGLA
jgi:putative endonuclease